MRRFVNAPQRRGVGYQTEMNRALREAATGMPLTAENLSAVVSKARMKVARAVAPK